MSGLELERKWLVSKLPDEVLSVRADAIEQGYLAVEAGGGEVRLRRREGRCFITVKSGSGMVRRELEVELSPEQFDALWPGTEGRRVEKSRRVVALAHTPGGLQVELDEYSGALAGLRVAEVEFADEATARSFSAPAWFGAEVTDRDEYRNRSLATRGRPATGP
ncbi:MAG TPA: CYTH domain-containing protein [Solirubrobacteraceae bacterium]|nr:CYTH domain-containing protein [Solirubrobacteraceae bacterium]